MSILVQPVGMRKVRKVLIEDGRAKVKKVGKLDEFG